MKNILDGNCNFMAKVSSVLNKNVKEFGKKYLFDGREDTCWNSDQGSPQFVNINFDEEVQTISQLQIMFQGGFVGTDCHLILDTDQNTKIDFFPDDSNKLQTFPLLDIKCKSIKIVFGGSTDFFGRITIYQLNLLQMISST
jgi:hypothetical protein